MTLHSATLAIDEEVRARRQAGQDVLHLGFGEAGLPIPTGLSQTLTDAHQRNGYGPVAGSPQARTAAAGWFTRRGLPTEPDQILLAPGSKPLLFALLAALDGDVVLPRPSWVSYAAQATVLGRRTIWVPTPREAGGIPDPEHLATALRQGVERGARPRALILTIPDNPTGTVAPAEQVRAVCALAETHGLTVISDEIYAELCHRGTAPSPAHYLPERTVVSTGLSKSLALGGWRIGYLRTPPGVWGRRLHQELIGVASEIWSSLAAPMQSVAAHALDEPPEIRAHLTASRHLHARIATALHARLTTAGAHCRPPQAGFYLYPDFAPQREALLAQDIHTSAELATHLLHHHGIAALPGSAFGDPDTTLTLRLATSLLYGTTPQDRRSALAADEPERLPWIAAALDRFSTELDMLTRGRAGRAA
ncbi:pyridoxal phosphate-dependent aminotransferase [Streptomyces sp. NPDC057743]|uniref:pyridoxal phosphate-dependent aminotransferase n=1 Tax=Streptomyces sp. NPDC057743 TaxID=3346236 RepID=UPI0036ADD948